VNSFRNVLSLLSHKQKHRSQTSISASGQELPRHLMGGDPIAPESCHARRPPSRQLRVTNDRFTMSGQCPLTPRSDQIATLHWVMQQAMSENRGALHMHGELE